MKLEILDSPDTEAIRLVGTLHIYRAEAAREALLDRLAHGRPLVLDLAGLDACDAAGLQLLLATRQSALRTGKPFAIRATAPAVEECARQLGVAPAAWLSPIV